MARQDVARTIYQLGLRAGLPANRALELVAAAHAESSLNPQAVNPSSGAAGLFQLLSSGYRQRAQQAGGLFNPVANTQAILPDYQAYWKRNPGAAPGAAGRDVERSGEGAGFYARPLANVRSLLGAAPATSRAVGATAPPTLAGPAAPTPYASPPVDYRRLYQSLIQPSQGTIGPALDARPFRGRFTPAVPDIPTVRPAPGALAPPAPQKPVAPASFQPLSTPLPTRSEFATVDPEGAPDPTGTRHHAAVDWFAPAGSPVRAPVAGTVVEAKPSLTSTGQVFGGTVKIQTADGRVLVFRHVDPAQVRVGQQVQPGDLLAGVTAWKSGSPHSHVELWKTLTGGYNYGNMLDPLTFLRRSALAT